MTRMRRRSKQAVALLATACVVTLMWPGPSSADDGANSLGGYQIAATAKAVRIQIYDDGIPLPTQPLDMGIGYSNSRGSSPLLASTSSIFWPGEALADGGLEQFLPGVSWNLRADASSSQATDAKPDSDSMTVGPGNDMQTSASDDATNASATCFGITGPASLLSNPLDGLQRVLDGFMGKPAPDKTDAKPAPIQVPNLLAGIVSLKGLTSDTAVKLGSDGASVTAHAAMSSLDLLGGLISFKGFDVSSTTVNNGKKATVSGTSSIGGLTVLGQDIGLVNPGSDSGGFQLKAPQLPDLLAPLGISITVPKATKSVGKAADGNPLGTFSATGMQITIDTAPLWKAFSLSTLLSPLGKMLSQIPTLGPILSGLAVNPMKIVIGLGSVDTSVEAAPAWSGDNGTVVPPATGGGNPGSGGGAIPNTDTGGSGIGGVTTGGGTGDLGLGTTPVDTGNGAGAGSGGGQVANPPTSLETQPTASAIHLPGLGTVPRMLILGALLLAAGLGWLLRYAALTLFGAGANCDFGLAKGVPNLRKG